MILRFFFAIWSTALIRSAICARVKPSGKMIFSEGGATGTVGVAFFPPLPMPTIATVTSQTASLEPTGDQDERDRSPCRQLV